MNPRAHIGGGLHTGTPYDAFHGRLVAQYTRSDGTHVTVMDFGRPPYIVPPADPDAAMKREKWPAPPSGGTAGNAAYYARLSARRQEQLRDLIDEHGPLSVRKAAQLLGCAASTLRAEISRSLDLAIIGCVHRHVGGEHVGYVGQEMPDIPRPLSRIGERMRAYLLGHGPSYSDVMGRDTGLSSKAIVAQAQSHPEVFVRLGEVRRATGGLPRPLWGLVGVHDKEQS